MYLFRIFAIVRETRDDGMTHDYKISVSLELLEGYREESLTLILFHDSIQVTVDLHVLLALAQRATGRWPGLARPKLLTTYIHTRSSGTMYAYM